MHNQQIQNWLETARWAASGGNTQPWKVEYAEGQYSIYLHLQIDPDYAKNPSMMDNNGFAAAMALGGLAKNLEIIAGNDGYSLVEIIFNDSDCVFKSSAYLVLQKLVNTTSPLTKSDILNRRTDRTKYSDQPVGKHLLKKVIKTIKKYDLEHCLISHENKRRLIKDFSLLEKTRWLNPKFLKSMLQEISFNKKDDSKIPSLQLGINSANLFLLRIFKKYHSLALFVLKLGLYKIFVYKNVGSLFQNSDKIFFLQTNNTGFKSCFELGQCYQEIWLDLNANGVAFQPISQGLIALEYWSNKKNQSFSENEVLNIRYLTEKIKAQYYLDLSQFVMGFRIGYPLHKTLPGVRKKTVAFLNDEIQTILKNWNQHKEKKRKSLNWSP